MYKIFLSFVLLILANEVYASSEKQYSTIKIKRYYPKDYEHLNENYDIIPGLKPYKINLEFSCNILKATPEFISFYVDKNLKIHSHFSKYRAVKKIPGILEKNKIYAVFSTNFSVAYYAEKNESSFNQQNTYIFPIEKLENEEEITPKLIFTSYGNYDSQKIIKSYYEGLEAKTEYDLLSKYFAYVLDH